MALADDVTAQHLGQPVEVEDASALDQCFDWAFFAADSLGLPRTSIRHGAAAQIWFNPNPDTDTYWDRVANTLDYIPPANALAIFGYQVGPYGHVAWCLSGSDVHNLLTSDENWNGHSYIERVNHANYYGCVGFLVPKSTPVASTVDTPTQDNEGVVNGAQLRGHAEPNTTSATQWYFDDNEHITLVSKTTGENVTTGPYAPSNYWYLAHGNDANAKNAGYPQVWVSDAFVKTKKTPANVPDYSALPVTPPAYSPHPTGQFVPDISSFQGEVDFTALKLKVDAVLIRAGHVGISSGGGKYNTDTKFVTNRDGARTVGLPCGFYWYGYPSLDPRQEAADFVGSVGPLKDGESLWLDLEETEPGVDTKTWAASFMDEVERLTNRTCHLYSYLDFIQNKADLSGLLTGSRELWLADYDNNPRPVPNRLKEPVAHQYWNQGKLPGITGNVDLSAFFEDFKSLAITIVRPNSSPDPQKPDGTAGLEQRVGALEVLVQKIIGFLMRYKTFQKYFKK